MIGYHHKFTPYGLHPEWLAESFRKADWIDVSKGWLAFGIDASFLKGLIAAFPNAGFHARLKSLTVERFKSHPFNPLPMMRLQIEKQEWISDLTKNLEPQGSSLLYSNTTDNFKIQ
ncbi:hypothetical protein FEF65_06100 [Mariprofundus erugo]|uniref:Uncharacterized protein n=1 Tax=Mariprofundus erugo TaxID=2528639 RepID=A0A5R9GRC1_9PROT|nr:hypothetical protein [Mariprofundus erugo]TLS67489.1 hypothetical protein FEF65_06100 [Mariprofundus erugo]